MCIAEDYKHMHVYLSVKKRKKINHSKNFAKLFNYLLLVEFFRKICKTKKVPTAIVVSFLLLPPPRCVKIIKKNTPPWVMTMMTRSYN